MNPIFNIEQEWDDPHLASGPELARRESERLKHRTERAIREIDINYRLGKPPPLGRKYEQFYGSDGQDHWELVIDHVMSTVLWPEDGTLEGLFRHVHTGAIQDFFPDNVKICGEIKFMNKDKHED